MPIINGRTYIIAEIGINHNGDLDIAKDLIRRSAAAGCDAVKFQKRTVDVVYSPEELARPRDNPFGPTNGDLKRGLEFGKEEYDEIDSFCKRNYVDWFASPWDEASVEFLLRYDIPYLKIASASVTDKDLLVYCAQTGKPLIISTGMCTLDMVRKVVYTVYDAGGEIASLLHCTSTYPSKTEELNLLGIKTLKQEFPNIRIGYSGHETNVPTTTMAIALGAEVIERHVTLDRSMWGSDQSASLEMNGFSKVVSDARLWEVARGDGTIKYYDSEKPIAEKLRRKDTL